jgi:hypothetical protein
MSIIKILTQISYQSFEQLMELSSVSDDSLELNNLVQETSLKSIDMNTAWGIVDYIFNTLYQIEVIHGKCILTETMSVCSPGEVKNTAIALNSLSDEDIRLGLEVGRIEKQKVYRFAWPQLCTEDKFIQLINHCNWVKSFHLDAAAEANAIIATTY